MTEMVHNKRRVSGASTAILCLAAAMCAGSSSAGGTEPPEARPAQAPAGPTEDPVDYVVDKLRRYDLVLIGEKHWVRQEPLFLQQLVTRCVAEDLIDVVFLELGRLEDQGKLDTFMKSPTYDPTTVIEILREETITGWGYQEYLDIFRRLYEENARREPSKRVRLVMVDPDFDEVDLWSYFDRHLKSADVPEETRRSVTDSLNDAIMDRDRAMADIIESCRYNLGLSRGIFYGGAGHVRKDLMQKSYGRRYFSVGGLLARRYPGRVCCLTLQRKVEDWQHTEDWACLERLFQSRGRALAIDSNDPALDGLKLKSTVRPEGVRLSEAFDGYIMLSPNKDRQPCRLIPGFYTDDFAQVVWERFREKGWLQRLPEPYSQWREKTPTGAELEKMVEEGLH